MEKFLYEKIPSSGLPFILTLFVKMLMMTDMMKYASLLSGTCYILLTISLYPTKLSNFDQVMRLQWWLKMLNYQIDVHLNFFSLPTLYPTTPQKENVKKLKYYFFLFKLRPYEVLQIDRDMLTNLPRKIKRRQFNRLSKRNFLK